MTYPKLTSHSQFVQSHPTPTTPNNLHGTLPLNRAAGYIIFLHSDAKFEGDLTVWFRRQDFIM